VCRKSLAPLPIFVLGDALVSKRSKPSSSRTALQVTQSSGGIHPRNGPFHAWIHTRRWKAARLACITVDATMVREILVPVHGHALAVPAKLTIGSGRDGARGVALVSTTLLECEQLLSTEGFVVDLCGRLDQVLQVGAGKEVAEVYEFTVGLVLDYSVLVRLAKRAGAGWLTIDDAPLVLATANVLAVDNNSSLGAHNGKGQELLLHVSGCWFTHWHMFSIP
jgi:hypothetical protein